MTELPKLLKYMWFNRKPMNLFFSFFRDSVNKAVLYIRKFIFSSYFFSNDFNIIK